MSVQVTGIKGTDDRDRSRNDRGIRAQNGPIRPHPQNKGSEKATGATESEIGHEQAHETLRRRRRALRTASQRDDEQPLHLARSGLTVLLPHVAQSLATPLPARPQPR